MRFSRLRVLGFKSFVEPSEFLIEGGLTGVVGPNGCGKSNLVEALRWVMGENSYKNMRASGMDDVIFSGSSTRPSRNTAEVTLFLDNRDRSAPPQWNDQDEIQVSRRIEREAGSVYRINGKEARAKDVQLLFADQSTGARSPSMVGQGRIGELIQAKPQARRQLLEEAAGISGLHTRRHEAELRLRAAEGNLERLDDVVGELESQIESLKRQARQANRFKSLSADIRAAEAILLHLRWSQARAHEAEAQGQLATTTAAVGDLASRQMNAAKDQAVGASGLPALREAEASAAAALQRLTIARTQLDEEAARLKSRQAELDKRLAQFAADIERERRMVSDNAEVLARLEDEERRLNSETDGAHAREIETRAAHEEAAARLKESEASLSALTTEKANAAAARHAMERRLRESRERRERIARQVGEADRELAEIARKLAALPDPSACQSALDTAEAARMEAEAASQAAEEAVDAAREGEADARTPLNAARSELNRIETEARTLRKIINSGGSGLFPAVVERMKVERGFETALGAALGEDLDAPLDAAAPAHWGAPVDGAEDPALPDGARPLAGVVTAPPQLARRLAQIGIVGEADGARLQALLKPGQRLVSQAGALWRWDGFVASADAPTAAAIRLEQKNRLAELDAEALEATGGLRMAEEAFRAAELHLRQAIEAAKAARETLRLKVQAVGEARAALDRAQKAAGEVATRKAAQEESRARLAEGLAEAETMIREAEGQMEDAPDLSDLQARLDALAREVAADRTRLAETKAAHEGLKREAEARARRLQAIAVERKGWIARAGNAERQIAALAEREAEARAERDTIEGGPEEAEARRRQLVRRIEEAETLRKQAADRRQAAENRQRDLDRSATDAIAALAQGREARARAEERMTAAQERREEAEARIREALNCPPHLVIRHTGLAPDAPMPDMGETERRLERLKIERERLGAVNLRAEEESREMAERLETIVTEREDVIEAIKKLRAAIQSLNREGRERLLDAFGKVNDQFQRLFSHLFGGGTAELQLIESDDPLDAGLEILARPPGKKPQTMTLLSGGEQALTAMALIFAVFLTNPAPICVLDEVDAPLDDHNVERFCNLMEEMAKSTETRFVIITHNPITMARMNRLFGVTMAEQGVSTLVSVDLQTAEQMREAV
ncbi:MAG: chromosome segregation SMC family protein [Zhengella sp.]|uniref:chromosome segregation SMC family protein n=1 Tax=Zhengella sp. TaxID=2282762 RepID=UPI003529CABF|nr:chromosome segregation protein SMC [Brucellaceae bacterium]